MNTLYYIRLSASRPLGRNEELAATAAAIVGPASKTFVRLIFVYRLGDAVVVFAGSAVYGPGVPGSSC